MLAQILLGVWHDYFEALPAYLISSMCDCLFSHCTDTEIFLFPFNLSLWLVSLVLGLGFRV